MIVKLLLEDIVDIEMKGSINKIYGKFLDLRQLL